MTRYGPYRNNCGYWFWIDYDGVHHKTVLVSREALAAKLGRQIRPNEHAHHIDGDRGNNAPENLELRDRSQHVREHAIRTWAVLSPADRAEKVRRLTQARRASAVRTAARLRKNMLRRLARARAKLAGGAVAER